MRNKIWLITLALLAGCIPVGSKEPVGDEKLGRNEEPVVQQEELNVELENFGPAPELQNEIWLNTEKPLRLSDLGGKVVLLDMWTFG